MKINQKGALNIKILAVFVFFVFLIGAIVFFTQYYPLPDGKITVGSIGGAQRVEKYRNVQTGKIELDKNEMNQFFQSVEWQNISKDKEMMKILGNQEVLKALSIVILAHNSYGFLKEIDSKMQALNIQTQEQLDAFLKIAFTNTSSMSITSQLICAQAMENNQLDNFKVVVAAFYNNNKSDRYVIALIELLNNTSLVENLNKADLQALCGQIELELVNTHMLNINEGVAQKLGILCNLPDLQVIYTLVANNDFKNIFDSQIFAKIVILNVMGNTSDSFNLHNTLGLVN